MEIQIIRNENQNSFSIIADVNKEVFLTKLPIAIFQEVVREVGKRIADEVMSKKGKEIMKSISPEAIANMAIAEAGAAVNETLKKKLPDKILEVVRKETEVWQRGFFGGMKRIK